jgi:hypothetical protein
MLRRVKPGLSSGWTGQRKDKMWNYLLIKKVKFLYCIIIMRAGMETKKQQKKLLRVKVYSVVKRINALLDKT